MMLRGVRELPLPTLAGSRLLVRQVRQLRRTLRQTPLAGPPLSQQLCLRGIRPKKTPSMTYPVDGLGQAHIDKVFLELVPFLLPEVPLKTIVVA